MTGQPDSVAVRALFTKALDAEGLLDDRLRDRPTDLDATPDDDDERVPLLLAISDNGTEMRSGDTRRFMALCSIAQQFGRPSTPDRPGMNRAPVGPPQTGTPAPARHHRPRRARRGARTATHALQRRTAARSDRPRHPLDEHEGRGDEIRAARLDLPVRGWRLRVHRLVGTVVDPVVPSTDPQGTTTVTPAQVIHQRRLHVLALAAELGNVSEACRLAGVSRTRFYEWKRVADLYGPDALLPKDRRRPQQPNGTPTHVVAELLTLAVLEPTIGCRQYADRLAGRGYQLSKSTVQKHLVDHQLGRRSQRVSRAAAVAAASGLVIDPVERDGPFGFCHYASDPGQLLALDSFYIGHLKGVGKVYQLTAVDTFSRWAVIAIIIGPPNASHTIAFIDRLLRIWRRRGVAVEAVLTDNGPEWKAGAFQAHLAAKGLRHQRIPPRSPNHNAVCERFHGTVLQECWRPAFHRRRFGSIGQLQAEADTWLLHYNHRRGNHGNYMHGRTPARLLDQHHHRNAS